MSWFDELFGNDKHSDEELLRRKNKRRHNSETQKNGEHTLLPENDDIYDRPRGKFRFPIDLGKMLKYMMKRFTEKLMKMNICRRNHLKLIKNLVMALIVMMK